MRFALPLLLAATLAACSTSGRSPSYAVDPADLADVDLRAGVTEEAVALRGGPEMAYILDVPEIASGERVPLVVAMPYAGDPLGTARQYHAVLAQPGLADLGAIVVVPVAFDVTWNTEPAVAAVASFVEAAAEAWPVDPTRVIVTGYSNGGNGTWAQAEAHPDLYSAAIPMGSFAPNPPPYGVPFYVVHGSGDTLFPPDRAQVAAALARQNGTQVEIELLPFGHYEAGSYVEGLTRAIGWVEREVWGR